MADIYPLPSFQNLLDLVKVPDLPADIRNLREIGLKSFITGLNSVLPEVMMPGKIRLTDDALIINGQTILRKTFSQVVIVGGGKATGGMCHSLVQVLGDEIPFSGEINIPYRQSRQRKLISPSGKSIVHVNFCGHPIPDESGKRGVERMLDAIARSSRSALIVALISGGGSALMPCPADGITLEDKQQVNRLLLECGASINEINAVRKHLSKLKGGQLSRFAYPRRVFSIILSDVIGNDLQTIASGPTVPDQTTFKDVEQICRKYKIFERLPVSVQTRILDGVTGKIPDTPKPGLDIFSHTTNHVIGSAENSAHIIQSQLKTIDIHCEIFTNALQGEAREYGKQLVSLLPNFHAPQYPAVFIGTGEFTVTLRGQGKGGRNQEMLLGFLQKLQSQPKSPLKNMKYVIISGAFDGIEGNSGAMGAIVDSSSLKRINKKHLNITEYLDQNNSFEFFKQLGDVIISGQTGTNVNDMTLILIDQKKSLSVAKEEKPRLNLPTYW